jgi:hypothetical protein
MKYQRRKTAERLRELLIQGCESRGITIVEGSVGKEHVHMLICMSDAYSSCKDSTILEGESIPTYTGIIFLVKEEILGTTSVGEGGVFLCNRRGQNDGNIV